MDGRFLLTGNGTLVTGSVFDIPKPYTIEDYKQYRQSSWGRSDEEGARQHFVNCADALKLIFKAAGKSAGGKQQLPGVLDSFMQWCEQTRADFQLAAQIDEELARRKFKMGLTQTYAVWRQRDRENPAVLAALGFKDDPTKSDGDDLRLEMEAVPGWAPGRSMKKTSPSVPVVLIPQGDATGATGK